MNGRYDGRRFLRLLELYVLAAIGELSDADRTKLVELTPHLRETYSCGGSWEDCISAAMEFPPDMPALIRERWTHNQRLARTNGEELLPEDFAVMFTDANFRDDSSG